MKRLLYLYFLFIYGCGEMYKQEEGVLYDNQMVAMPEGYRKLTGYDSIQVLYYKPGSPLGDGWEGHFCYPNEWEFEKFKK